MKQEPPITKYEGIVYVNYHYGEYLELKLYDFVEYWGTRHKVTYDFHKMFAPFADKKIQINIEVLDENPNSSNQTITEE